MIFFCNFAPDFLGEMSLNKKQYDCGLFKMPAVAFCSSLIAPPQQCNLLIIKDLLKVATATVLTPLGGSPKGFNAINGFKEIHPTPALPIKIILHAVGRGGGMPFGIYK